MRPVRRPFLFYLPPDGVAKEKSAIGKEKTRLAFPPPPQRGTGGTLKTFPRSLRVSQNLAGVKGRKIFPAAGATQENFFLSYGALDTAENLPEGDQTPLP